MTRTLCRILTDFLLAAGLLVTALAQTPPVVQVVAFTPEPGSQLAAGQTLYVRVAYESAQPLRLQARGFLGGANRDQMANNPSPVFPAGSGEAVVWLFGEAGARIDEVRVQVYDAKWGELFEVPAPVSAEWRAGVSAAPEAAWAAGLIAAQAKIPPPPPVPATAKEKGWDFLLRLLVPLAFLSVPGWPLLQVYALWKLRGPRRLLSGLPLSFMLPVYAYCLYALQQGSNLWPLYAIFASPVALIITLAVVLVARRRGEGEVAPPIGSG
jgi:hypothetical protein